MKYCGPKNDTLFAVATTFYSQPIFVILGRHTTSSIIHTQNTTKQTGFPLNRLTAELLNINCRIIIKDNWL